MRPRALLRCPVPSTNRFGDRRKAGDFVVAPNEPTTLHAAASNQRAQEAGRVLQAALAAAGLSRVARLVITERAGPSTEAVELMPLRPDEARQLAALIDRSLLAVHG